MNFENIKLEKGMYKTAGKNFSQVLTELDPDDNYKGTELEGLDAFQRQLKRFDIKVNGRNSDIVEKFFKSSQTSALFPEYVSRAIRQGMEEANALSDIVATVTKIDGLDYRTITSAPTEDAKTLKRVAEGAKIPETIIKTQENLVKLRKRGRMLVASYEAIRFQRLDLFTVTLRQIGAYIARSQFADAVNTILNGDGNNAPATVIDATTADTLAYGDVLNLWNGLAPYNMTTVLASPDVMLKLLNLSEFKSTVAGSDFHVTGKIITPLGAQVIRSSAVPTGMMIGLDKNCALEMIEASDVMLETDKLIDRQLERAAITAIAGFAKIFTDASMALKISE